MKAGARQTVKKKYLFFKKRPQEPPRAPVEELHHRKLPFLKA